MDSHENPSKVARSFSLRLALFYGAIFAGLGIYLPYLPVWLASRGMTPAEIGILAAAPMFLRVIATPAIAFYADARGDLRETILISSWLGLLAVLLLNNVSGFWPILFLILLFQLTFQSILPLTEAKAMSGIRAYKLDYGRIRLWGSVAFIAANLIGGMAIAQYSSGVVLIMVSVAVVIMIVTGHALPHDDAHRPKSTTQPGQSRKIRISDVSQLATAPWFLILMIASGAIQSSHAVFYAFSAIHWRAQNISDGWIGALWALGVIAEVGLFAISGRLMQRIGPIGLIIVGGIAAVIRWFAMVFDPSFWALLPLQLLHALTFGATFLGTLHILQNSVPENQAGSAQGLHAALAPGIITGVVTVIAGQIYEPMQAMSYLVMSALAVIGIVSALALPQLVPKPEIIPAPFNPTEP